MIERFLKCEGAVLGRANTINEAVANCVDSLTWQYSENLVTYVTGARKHEICSLVGFVSATVVSAHVVVVIISAHVVRTWSKRHISVTHNQARVKARSTWSKRHISVTHLQKSREEVKEGSTTRRRRAFKSNANMDLAGAPRSW
jgi:hypothetical protein